MSWLLWRGSGFRGWCTMVVIFVLCLEVGGENLESLGVLVLPAKVVAPERSWICLTFPATEIAFLW